MSESKQFDNLIQLNSMLNELLTCRKYDEELHVIDAIVNDLVSMCYDDKRKFIPTEIRGKLEEFATKYNPKYFEMFRYANSKEQLKTLFSVFTQEKEDDDDSDATSDGDEEETEKNYIYQYG
jgi:hypothetical protein